MVPMGRRRVESAVADLGRHCRGELLVTASALEPYCRDFGGMVRRVPSAVLRPQGVDDVAAAMRIAAEHQVPISTRGSGHSQAGQSLGEGLVIDMRSLNRLVGANDRGDVIEVEAGAQWRTVVDAAFARGRIPCGLTHVLDTTVAGTLSVAGVGSESWRIGPQVDNVTYLDVVTLDGKVRRAAVDQDRELFDAVRGGLGQVGAIVRVGYPLRPCRSRVRSRFFVYSSVERFIGGVERICREPEGLLFGALTRSARERRWVLLLVVGTEYDVGSEPAKPPSSELDFDEELPEQDAPLWDQTGVPGHLFFRLHAPSPSSLDADPATLHPWVEHIFPRDGARLVLDALMNDRSGVLGLGTNGIIMVRRKPDPAPLFATPAGADLLWGIGLFPSVAPWFQSDAQDLLSAHEVRGREAQGKRYLSGFVRPMPSAEWGAHYGTEVWRSFCLAKAALDPERLLNAGFVTFG
jgi:cytokinin dehydrogenase